MDFGVNVNLCAVCAKLPMLSSTGAAVNDDDESVHVDSIKDDTTSDSFNAITLPHRGGFSLSTLPFYVHRPILYVSFAACQVGFGGTIGSRGLGWLKMRGILLELEHGAEGRGTHFLFLFLFFLPCASSVLFRKRLYWRRFISSRF